jgi:hypothetical protein
MGPKPKPRRPADVAVDDSIAPELDFAGDRSLAQASQSAKKNYAQALSNSLARKVADALRGAFPGILPDAAGRGAESRARTKKGFKKLDVNFSTLELGLALGVSLKSVNFPEGKANNYAKNVTRVDNELRAEAEDYHARQPFAVLVALYFTPVDAADNATKKKPSSFGHMVRILRHRAERRRTDDPPSLFEKIYIALYVADGPDHGKVSFFDVEHDPPWSGMPSDVLTFSDVMNEIRREFADRNKTEFTWADVGLAEDDPATPEDEALESDESE